MVSRLGLVPERLIFIGEVDKCCLILLFEPSSASPAYASRWLPDHNRIRHRRTAGHPVSASVHDHERGTGADILRTVYS